MASATNETHARATQYLDEVFTNFLDGFPKDPEIQKRAKQTMQRLVSDLERKSSSYLRNQLIQKAKNFNYSDFISKNPFPQRTLHTDLQQAGFNDLAENVINGAYDEAEEYTLPVNPSQKVNSVAQAGICKVCSNPASRQLCGRCHKVSYCSIDCQRKDWPTHKNLCKPSENKRD